MKKEAILLLIAVGALLLIEILLYFDYKAIIIINILILIVGKSYIRLIKKDLLDCQNDK